ncbi:hypothetical protein HYDPIDRAFT_102707 [Hydnomerulius pinastri MD-312]|uniref:Uncharacterized protein n=1 Tax=Hydnomerulius pinastri MD-312 TaxID=994086 RepID=A0A0C9VYD8_9AGAM|nr:hypothetical protein HYDPIDRAFT_102707 [Hydnomerulius pinastri MD-312]
MQALIRQKKAPCGAIAPLPIACDGLFKLDVDDDVWQDLGLGDELSEVLPGWLADEKVRLGIWSLLEMERCEEEESRLKAERSIMQEWFFEEWSRIQRVTEDLAFELHRQSSNLVNICVEWQAQVHNIQCAWPVPDGWGPSTQQLSDAAVLKEASVYMADYREGGMEEEEEDREGSGSEFGADDELLDAVEEFALADEY